MPPEHAPPTHRDLRGLVLTGGAFLFARQVASMGLSLIGLFIVTRIIGPESYGAYATAFGISQCSQNFGQTGIAVYLVRHAKEVSEHDYRVASTLLLAMSLFLVLCFEAAADLVGEWVEVPQFPILFRVIVLSLPLQFLGTVASARLARALDFRRSAIIEFVAQLAYYLAAIPLALSGLGAWSLVSAWIVQQVVSCVLFHTASRYAFVPAWSRSLVAAMVVYGTQFSIANAWSQLRSLVNPLIVGHFLGAEAVGYVALTARMVEVLAVVRTITFRLSIAAFGRIQDDKAKLVRAITDAMQLQTLAIAPMLLAFSWFGALVFIPLVGERWLPVIALFPYVALGNLSLAQFNVHASALYVVNRNLQVSVFTSLNLVLLAAGCAATVTQAGIIGYGYGELLALPSYLVLHLFVVRYIGAPDYRVSFIWWLGAAIGLFWRELGWWAILAPFLALVFPSSIRQIRGFVTIVWRNWRTPLASEPSGPSDADLPA